MVETAVKEEEKSMTSINDSLIWDSGLKRRVTVATEGPQYIVAVHSTGETQLYHLLE